MIYLIVYVVGPVLFLYSIYKFIQIARTKFDAPVVLGATLSCFIVVTAVIQFPYVCSVSQPIPDWLLYAYSFLVGHLFWLMPVCFILLRVASYWVRNNKPGLNVALKRYSVATMLIFLSIVFSWIPVNLIACAGTDFIENGQIISG
jgi:hypothetical protein